MAEQNPFFPRQSGDSPDVKESVGLAFELNYDETEYAVRGIGSCADTEIVIPKMYEGLPVTKIRQTAFSDCTALTSITIPDSVTEIEWFAFEGCTSLASISIPNSVTKIGRWAFSDCTALTHVFYSGTKEQWARIQFANDWNVGSFFTVIHCADGDVEA